MKLSDLIKELVDILAEHGDMPVHFRQHGPDAWWLNETDHPRPVAVRTSDSLAHTELVL